MCLRPHEKGMAATSLDCSHEERRFAASTLLDPTLRLKAVNLLLPLYRALGGPSADC